MDATARARASASGSLRLQAALASLLLAAIAAGVESAQAAEPASSRQQPPAEAQSSTEQGHTEMDQSFDQHEAPPPRELPRNKREAAADWSADGLEKTSIKGLDLVYVRPGASLAGYSKVLLRPVSISFRREWNTGPGSLPRMSAEDAARIRARLAALLQEELGKELAAGGYAVATGAGEDVLELQPSITDLHAAAPDVRGPQQVDIYAFSAGEMTLVAELRDSVSGDLIMRIYDRHQALETGMPHRITLVENQSEARRAAQGWARVLRRELDLAKAAGAKR